MIPHLNALHLNINGLRNKRDILENWIKQLDLDVIALSETKLNSSISPYLIELEGYSFLRLDRTKNSGGGLLVYFKSNLTVELVSVSHNPKQCEHMTFSVKASRRKTLYFSLIYRPPNCNVDTFLTSFEQFLMYFDHSSPHCLLGDFNIDLSLPITNNKAEHFLNILSAFSYKQTVNEATRLALNKSSLLDLIIVNNRISCSNSSVLDCTFSDHQATLLQWNIELEHKSQRHLTFTYRSLKTFDKEVFNSEIIACNWTDFYQQPDPDAAWNIFSSNILTVWNKLAPLKKCRIKAKPKGNKPWITNEILKAMELRDMLYKQFKNTLTKEKFSEYKLARNRVNTLINRNRFIYFQNHFNNDTSGKSHWQSINNLLGKSSKPHEHTIKPNTFAMHFANISTHHNTNQPQMLPTFDSFLPAAPNINFNLEACTINDIKLLLKNLNGSHSCGWDGISNFMLKSAGSSIISPLVHLFNLCISTSRLPIEWKKAKVTPIFKKGDSSQPSNYRPISLLSSTSKLFERFLCSKLTHYFESNSLFCRYQHGFRSNHSTISALICLTEHINIAIDKNKFVLATFLDLSKAFDMVHHKTLLHKLSYYGIKDSNLLLLKNYLEQRHFSVYLSEDNASPFHPLLAGVPQGSVLGPLLFLIYTNDLQHSLSYSSINLYADDTVICTTSSSFHQAQSLLIYDVKQIITWFKANHLKLNVDKTQYIVFGTKHMTKNCPSHPITIEGNQINRCKHVKYLGMELDENLTYTQHISTLCNKVCRILGPLNSIKHLIPYKIRKSVYQAIVLPHFTYGISLWSTTSSTQLCRVKKVLNRTCRQVLSVKKPTDMPSSECYKKLQWMDIEQLAKYHLLLDAFRLINLHAPFSVVLPPRTNTVHSHFTRSNFSFQRLPFNNSYGLKTLAHRISYNWNLLSPELKCSQSISAFKKSLKLTVLDRM